MAARKNRQWLVRPVLVPVVGPRLVRMAELVVGVPHLSPPPRSEISAVIRTLRTLCAWLSTVRNPRRLTLCTELDLQQMQDCHGSQQIAQFVSFRNLVGAHLPHRHHARDAAVHDGGRANRRREQGSLELFQRHAATNDAHSIIEHRAARIGRRWTAASAKL